MNDSTGTGSPDIGNFYNNFKSERLQPYIAVICFSFFIILLINVIAFHTDDEAKISWKRVSIFFFDALLGSLFCCLLTFCNVITASKFSILISAISWHSTFRSLVKHSKSFNEEINNFNDKSKT